MNNYTEIINYRQWPRTPEGEPILMSTEDALYYSKLIFQNNNDCWDMLDLWFSALFHLDSFKYKDDPDLQEFINLACKAQLYRECLEEIRRIRIDHKTL